MTTVTVEYEEVVTKEEPVDVCDDCGREVDEDGASYNPEKVTTPSLPTLDYCSECLEEKTGEPILSARAEEWAESKDGAGFTMKANLEFLHFLAVAMLVLNCVIIVASITAGALVGGGLGSAIGGSWLVISLVFAVLIKATSNCLIDKLDVLD